MRFLSHAARAWSIVPLLLVACTTGGLMLARHAGLLGLPLLAILASWFAKYAFVLLESTANGRPPPVFAIEMANPWDERRPLGALLVVATVVGVLALVRSVAGDGAASIGTALALVLAPASLAVLAIDGTPFRALDPTACLRVVRGIGLAAYSALVVGAWLLVAAAVMLVSILPAALGVAAALLLVLTYAALLGGAIHARRLELGFEPIVSPERDAARAARERARELDGLAERLYGLVRARRPELAWQEAEQWLAASGHSIDDRTALLARADRWEDVAIAERLRRDTVTRLLALGRRGDALLLIEAALRRGRRWRPADGRELVRLIQVARDVGHAATAERLLAECAGEFPADPEVQSLRTRGAG